MADTASTPVGRERSRSPRTLAKEKQDRVTTLLVHLDEIIDCAQKQAHAARDIFDVDRRIIRGHVPESFKAEKIEAQKRVAECAEKLKLQKQEVLAYVLQE